MQVKHLLLIAILAMTAACSSTKEVVDENLSEVELYQQAQTDLNNHSYTSATAKLKALESRYPFGRYADQAQLELIYANYKNAEPEAAKSAAERFIRLHPQHPNVDYAYYLKLAVLQAWVVRVVELQGFQAGGPPGGQGQALVSLGHHGQAVTHRWGPAGALPAAGHDQA